MLKYKKKSNILLDDLPRANIITSNQNFPTRIWFVCYPVISFFPIHYTDFTNCSGSSNAAVRFVID